MTREQEQDAIRGAAAEFPPTFGLAAFPNEVFRISETASYISGTAVTLYTEKKTSAGQWVDFAKGTPAEIRAQLVKIGGRK